MFEKTNEHFRNEDLELQLTNPVETLKKRGFSTKVIDRIIEEIRAQGFKEVQEGYFSHEDVCGLLPYPVEKSGEVVGEPKLCSLKHEIEKKGFNVNGGGKKIMIDTEKILNSKGVNPVPNKIGKTRNQSFPLYIRSEVEPYLPLKTKEDGTIFIDEVKGACITPYLKSKGQNSETIQRVILKLEGSITLNPDRIVASGTKRVKIYSVAEIEDALQERKKEHYIEDTTSKKIEKRRKAKRITKTPEKVIDKTQERLVEVPKYEKSTAAPSVKNGIKKSLNHKILGREEEYELLTKSKSENEDEKRAAINTLVRMNQKLVMSIAKLYSHRMPIEDLMQEGTMGLLKAIEKYDLKKKSKLSTYALWWIRQYIVRALQNTESTIRIPVHRHEVINRVKQIERKLNAKGTKPTSLQIAEEAQISIEELEELRKEANIMQVEELDAPISNQEGNTRKIDLVEDTESAEKNDRYQAIKEIEEIKRLVLSRTSEDETTEEKANPQKENAPIRFTRMEATVAIRRILTIKAERPSGNELAKEIGGNRSSISKLEASTREKIRLLLQEVA